MCLSFADSVRESHVKSEVDDYNIVEKACSFYLPCSLYILYEGFNCYLHKIPKLRQHKVRHLKLCFRSKYVGTQATGAGRLAFKFKAGRWNVIPLLQLMQ